MMEKLFVICCFLSHLMLGDSQDVCTFDFITATCNPEVPITVIPDNIPADSNSIRRIILNGNAISTVYPGNLSFYPVLDYLDLSDNLISIIPADLETEPLVITELVLDKNPIVLIEDGALEQMNSLFTLSLRETSLTTLGRDVFIGPEQLDALYLQDSKLEFLDDDTFELVKLLTELNLRGNSLQILPEGIFTGLPLNDLFLSGNPWSCDCRMQWFKTYIDNNAGIIQDIGSLTCEWPFTGIQMTDLTINDFNCSAPSIKIHPSNDSIVTELSYTLTFEVEGTPFPNVTWYKNGQPIQYTSNIYLNTYDASLHFNNTVINDSAVYYALIENEYGLLYSNEATLIVTEVTCFNGGKNDDETDIDCGGRLCTPCNQTQSCLVDSDCLGELVCLYSYELPSRLHYISPNSPDAYRCDNPTVPGELLNNRLQIGLQSIELFGSNFTVESEISSVHNAMKMLLSSLLKVNEVYISDVQITTVERSSAQSSPLIQVWFNLVKNSHGRAARSTLLSLINEGKISGTIRIRDEQSYYTVRLNL